jgi:PAS domain S-box-containing protein
MIPVLTIDTVEGQRQPVPPGRPRLQPTALTQQVLEHGAKLINRTDHQAEAIKLVPFGSPRRSASLMFVPIRSAGVPVGVLSIQSYTPRAYSEEDLQVLQILAAHCGDALRRIEITEALQAADAKYRGIVENAAEGIFQTTPEGRYLTANAAQARLLGYESATDLIAGVQNIEKQTYVVPAQRAEFTRRMEAEGTVQGFEVERVRRDGQKIWVSLTGHAVRDAGGKTLYYECTSHDITQRKLAELELRRLSHLILEAREAERQRVARELHDGVNQIIASARMRLSKVRERTPELGPAAREILSRSEALLVEALEENRRIAHNLRPVDLDHLGLAVVCRNFCRELSANSGLDARCRVTGLAARLDPGLELNLFRVLQEATTNIQKHARARSVRVNLTRAGGDVRLTIRDDGRGFDLEKARSPRRGHRGVGLTSMRERITNLGGTLEVKSIPKQGTTIAVRVPAVEAAARPPESGD